MASLPSSRKSPETTEQISFRALPSVARLLENPVVQAALERLPRRVVVEALRAELENARRLLSGNDRPLLSHQELIARAIRRAEQRQRPSLRPAINATGVILHTGLGRSVLSEAAARAIAEVAGRHSVLEIEPETGKRGSRQSHIQSLLCDLTGAESALVVNNNAGATFLAVTALASGREVIISRGELVEIGGSFRMPDIIRASGAMLIEVGTTNRTRIRDYEAAITERTGLLLRCHPSNFRILGFTEETRAQELVQLGRTQGLPVMDDLGSGAILDLSVFGTGPTTTLREAVASGCDVITASGDKLLGGPQAGLILGKRKVIEQIAHHPLARALRCDKLTLAALEATLRLYLDEETARREIPTLRYLSRSYEQLEGMAGRLLEAIAEVAGSVFGLETVAEQSQVGGGSLPGEDLPTCCVRVRPTGSGLSVEDMAACLRRYAPAIFARIKDQALLLDPRTLEEEEFAEIAGAFGSIAQKQDGQEA